MAAIGPCSPRLESDGFQKIIDLSLRGAEVWIAENPSLGADGTVLHASITQALDFRRNLQRRILRGE